MKNIMSAINNEVDDYLDEPRILLTQIWHVECGPDYDTDNHAKNPHFSPKETQHIAIRTLAGEGELWMRNGEPVLLPANSLIIVNVHDGARWRCNKVEWKFEFYRFEIEDVSNLIINQVHTVEITETERRMSEECHMNLGGISHFQMQYAQSLFKSLLALWHIEDGRKSLRDASIEHCISYVIQKLSLKATVLDIAHELNMSEKKLRRIFIECTGLPPKRYVEEKRLKTVLELLETSTMTIKEIADQCGFYNQSHLNRCFKNKFGYPPKLARMKVKLD